MTVDVTVVIAAKDEERYVEEAVRSVALQRGLSVELVFVDDSSTDRTYEIVSSLAGELPNIRIFRNPRRGKSSAFSYGVSLSNGQFVALFAGDDIMPEGSLAARWRAIKDVRSERPIVGLSRLVSFSEDKRFNGVVVPKDPNRGGLTGTSYLMDRRAISVMFPVPEELPNEDTWLEAAAQFMDMELVHSGVIGCNWRVHAGNSASMNVPFTLFNQRLTIRRAAYKLFLDRNGEKLNNDGRARLIGRVRCEDARKRGNLLGIILSGDDLQDMLRAISLSNALFYAIRQRLYRYLTGLRLPVRMARR